MTDNLNWSYYTDPRELDLAEDLTEEDYFVLSEALVIIREFHAVARRDGATEHADAYARYIARLLGELERRLNERLS